MNRKTTEYLISCEFKSKSKRKVLGPSLGEKKDSDTPQKKHKRSKKEMLSVRWLWGSKQRFQWAAESQGTQPEDK